MGAIALGFAVEKYITQKRLKHKYPFTIKAGVLRWELSEQKFSNGLPVPYLIFEAGQERYAVNGYARQSGRYQDFETIHRDDPKKPGVKIPMAAVMAIALDLLKREHPELHQFLVLV